MLPLGPLCGAQRGGRNWEVVQTEAEGKRRLRSGLLFWRGAKRTHGEQRAQQTHMLRGERRGVGEGAQQRARHCR